MKVLLVDDEPLTTESLERYMDWELLGVSNVRSAANGVEALELMRDFVPDIIVSDVRMPRMNGIEFATQAREAFPKIKLIFLSGYSDKEYLKSAIHLKAINYVEKPVKLEELTAAIRESISQLIAEQSNQTLTQFAIHERILNMLVNESVPQAQLRLKFGAHFPAFLDQPVRAMAIQLSHPSDAKLVITDEQQTVLIHQTQQIINDLNNSERFIGFVHNDTLILLVNAQPIHADTFKTLARQLLYSFNQQYGDSLAFSIGIGTPNLQPNQLKEACLSAIFAVKSSFYFGTGLVFSEPPTLSGTDPNNSIEVLYNEFRQALRDDQEPETLVLIDRLTTDMRTLRDPEISRVKNVYFRLLMILHEFALEKGLSVTDPHQEEKFIWKEVGEMTTLQCLQDYVVGNVQAVFSQFKEHNAVNARVSTIVHYIKNHYADADLTTKTIADNTFLSQNYMCALFKKETSKTINEYITEVRLEKAKQLLKNRQLKLYEIAHAIGFTDPNYFSSMFKKAVGLTPSQYRDKR
ncbi:MAG: response regulator [Candidatus Cohnella colombiensis]|uniref:Response regulator n=1 Tax=Candidatus Cohnella colombiensis TaxID=3121368 RepID=A0AA95F4I0_9BACL|nr:MAG: response regulator [Cohnella sp.]